MFIEKIKKKFTKVLTLESYNRPRRRKNAILEATIWQIQKKTLAKKRIY